MFFQEDGLRIYKLKRSTATFYRKIICMFLFTALKAMWDELTSYSKVLTCICGTSKDSLSTIRTGISISDGLISHLVHCEHKLTLGPMPNINKIYYLVLSR